MLYYDGKPLLYLNGVADNGKVSDGDHSFEELYDHRSVLYIAFLCLEALYGGDTWKSHKHHDGSGYDGWFIAGVKLDGVKDITYHIPDKYWDLCKAEELDKAPEWDGHTSADVLERLIEWIKK